MPAHNATIVPYNMRIKSHKVVAYIDESVQLLGWTGYRLGPERRGWQNYIDTLRKPFDIALLMTRSAGQFNAVERTFMPRECRA